MEKLFRLFFVPIILVWCSQKINTAPATNRDIAQDEQPLWNVFHFDETSYDFGIIKQSAGKVQKGFPFTYTGKDPITITSLPTSCACTVAQVSTSHLTTGQTGTVLIIFNPNLHAEPKGKFFKSVLLLTNPALPTPPELKIRVEIDLDLWTGAFELTGTHDDEGEE